MQERQMEAQVQPMEASEEATEEQLRLARRQGEAFAEAMQAMKEETGVLEARQVGDYEIAVTVEEAEGLYEFTDGPLGLGERRLQWKMPQDENCHIEVAVRGAADGRFIPEVPVHVTVYTADGREVGSHRHEFLWHPWLCHYGRNWRVPGDGQYRIPRAGRPAPLAATRL